LQKVSKTRAQRNRAPAKISVISVISGKVFRACPGGSFFWIRNLAQTNALLVLLTGAITFGPPSSYRTCLSKAEF
jgi:hypothetical protein